MKQLFILIVLAGICPMVKAQKDSIPAKKDTLANNRRSDTVHIGNIVVIKHGKKRSGNDSVEVSVGKYKKKRTNTNWFVFDLGFSNYVDKNDYSATGSVLVNRPGTAPIGESDFKLRTGKSINVNFWFFMQKLNLVKSNLNLKYGLGLELNNYRYQSAANISYKQGGELPYSPGVFSSSPFIFRDSISFSKNKLAADYITLPLMLNYTANARDERKALSISLGVSGGYLYSQRNKQKSNERGKRTNKGEYDLERFKFSYVGEVGLGAVHLYGSYSPKSMYENSLDVRPYTLGLRFSNW